MGSSQAKLSFIPSSEVNLQFTSLAELFFQSAERFAERPAVQDGGVVLRYDELAERVRGFASYLRKTHDKDIVAFSCRKGIPGYIVVLGILASGKAYLPLNRKWPAKRKLEVLSAAGVLSSSLVEHEDLPSAPDCIPRFGFNDSAHAYLMFTSGTTGAPKGILIRQSSVLSYLKSISEILCLKPTDRVSQVFDLSFDLSVHDMFTAWQAGACLVNVSENDCLSPSKTIVDSKLTVWFSTPSIALKQDPSIICQNLRESLFCGEPLPTTVAKAWRIAAPQTRIHNLYGPTEATIGISIKSFEKHDEIPETDHGLVSIGKIIAPNEFRLGLDDELLLRGPQVISSYYQSVESDKFDSQGWYKTGDQVQLAKDDLQFKRRLDDQVKLRGFRLELTEIEAVFSRILGRPSVALVSPEPPQLSQILYLFYIGPELEEDQKLDAFESARELLPEYMMPFDIFSLEKFPLNANGKMDRKSLSRLLFEKQSK